MENTLKQEVADLQNEIARLQNVIADLEMKLQNHSSQNAIQKEEITSVSSVSSVSSVPSTQACSEEEILQYLT